MKFRLTLFLVYLGSVTFLSCHKKSVQEMPKPKPDTKVYHADGEVKRLLYNDPQGVNLVILGDAFIKDDLDTGGYYDTQVKALVDYFFSVAPYKQNKQHF
jgi:hypothetical protein